MTIRTRGAGARRHIVVLQQKVETPDNQGGIEVTWPNVTSFRAEMKPIPGRVSDDQASHHARVAYYPGIDRDTHRLAMENPDRIFSILSVTNIDELGRELQIVVRENQ